MPKSNKIKHNLNGIQLPAEFSNYPEDPVILYKTDRSYSYTILKVGTYPKPPILKFTRDKRYKIPNNYTVETTWGRVVVTIIVLFDAQ